MSDLTLRHCKTCTCTIGVDLQFRPPTNAAAGAPNILTIDVTAAGAAPLVLPRLPLPGAAAAMPPLTIERITVGT